MRIFVSYSRKDITFATRLAHQLRVRGAEVFLDYQSLMSGDNWMEKIGDEITNADRFILVISKNSVESRYVRGEFTWAVSKSKLIHPVVLEDTNLGPMFMVVQYQEVDCRRWFVDEAVDDEIVKLAIAFGLPNDPILENGEEIGITVDAGTTAEKDFTEPISEEPLFARKDLAEMFRAAAEIQDENPINALYIYEQIESDDPTFMSGQIERFIAREKPRLQALQIRMLLDIARDAVARNKWTEASARANEILDLDGSHSEAYLLREKCEQNMQLEPIYDQALAAVEQGSWKAALIYLKHIAYESKTFGDTALLYSRAVKEAIEVALPHFEWREVGYRVPINNEDGTRGWKRRDFSVSKFPITRRQFSLFVLDPNGYRNSLWWDYSPDASLYHINNPEFQEDDGDDLEPMTKISPYEAIAFCKWLGNLLGEDIRVTSQKEWKLAVGRYKFPWGNSFNSKLCNTLESGIKRITPVNAFPDGKSSWDVWDLFGNVYEMTRDLDADEDYITIGCSYEATHDKELGFISTRSMRMRDDVGFRVAKGIDPEMPESSDEIPF